MKGGKAERRVAFRERLAGALHLEVLPDPRGAVGFGILVFLLAAHLLAFPDQEGRLFGNLVAHLPPSLRAPLLDLSLEGIGQAVLLIGPLVCVYAALRHLTLEGDSLLPYFTLVGGGFLALVTCAAVIVALGSRPGGVASISG